jgi:hypothetical protein
MKVIFLLRLYVKVIILNKKKFHAQL